MYREADNFQNLTSSSLPKDTALDSGIIITQIRSVVFTEVANRQTNRQRDKYHEGNNNNNKNLKYKDKI